MSDLIVVTGTPGAGKTTVLNKALSELGGQFTIANYGDAMFEAAQKEKLVNHRDEMRKLPPEVQKKIQKAAAKQIAAKANKNSVIVDTHCTIKTPKGYLPGMPMWVLEELKPKTVILVEADPKDIAGRRKNDETRVRDMELTSEIDEHQQINRATAMAYAVVVGATVKTVKNADNGLDAAVKEMKKALEK